MKKYILLTFLLLTSLPTLFSQTADKQPLRLKVATYNVGHFNEGELGGYQKGDVQTELQRWRNWVGSQALDILSVNEWNKNFDKEQTISAQQEILDPVYKNIYWGTENTWIYNGIATNYELTNLREVKWAGEYYAIVGDLVIGEKTITIISTHIPWQKEWHEQAINDLITELKKYEYAICMGDINAKNANQLKFSEAGFNIANGGFQGFFVTYPQKTDTGDGCHLDNIITTKNIKIVKIEAPENALTARDHYPIVADVIITW